MGNNKSRPRVASLTHEGEGEILPFHHTGGNTIEYEDVSLLTGHASHIGLRPQMEDSHAIDTKSGDLFFGIFDGHGGDYCSKYVAKRFFPTLKKHPSFASQTVEALTETCFQLDKDWLQSSSVNCGSTGICVLLKERKLYIINIGDSRCILVNDKEEVAFATRDHKPDDPQEKARIIEKGGMVEDGRVNAKLGVARCFGDPLYKNMREFGPGVVRIPCWTNLILIQTSSHLCGSHLLSVTVEPDIEVFDLDPSMHFLVLGCDGLWDVLQNKDVKTFVERRLRNEMKIDRIAEELVAHALDLRSTDNISTLFLFLVGSKPENRQPSHDLVHMLTGPLHSLDPPLRWSKQISQRNRNFISVLVVVLRHK